MSKISTEQVKDIIVTSREVLDILGIKRARLSQLAKSKKLVPIKKNLYLLEDVIQRKTLQEQLRDKYYRPRINTDCEHIEKSQGGTIS